jgi:hypothetical protein
VCLNVVSWQLMKAHVCSSDALRFPCFIEHFALETCTDDIFLYFVTEVPSSFALDIVTQIHTPCTSQLEWHVTAHRTDILKNGIKLCSCILMLYNVKPLCCVGTDIFLPTKINNCRPILQQDIPISWHAALKPHDWTSGKSDMVAILSGDSFLCPSRPGSIRRIQWVPKALPSRIMKPNVKPGWRVCGVILPLPHTSSVPRSALLRHTFGSRFYK